MGRSHVMRLLVAGAVLVSLVVGGLAVLVLPRLSASAAHAPEQVTRGDAEAIFNADFTGCGAIMVHDNLHEGQPCEDIARAQLRLFAVSTQHYCVDDWHVIRVTFLDFTRESVAAFDATIVIDGQPLATRRTPIKPVNPKDAAQFGPGPSYWVNVGTIVPPSALGVGTHTSHVEVVNPAVIFDLVFEIDASGTGACLLS